MVKKKNTENTTLEKKQEMNGWNASGLPLPTETAAWVSCGPLLPQRPALVPHFPNAIDIAPAGPSSLRTEALLVLCFGFPDTKEALNKCSLKEQVDEFTEVGMQSHVALLTGKN